MSVLSTVVSTLCLFISAIYCRDIPIQQDNSQGSVNVLEKFSWSCANNASCVRSVTYGIARDYFKGHRINFGLFSIAKLPPLKQSLSEARYSKFGSLIGGNAIRVPFGPMVFSIARAEDDKDYIELAIMKSGADEARRRVGGIKDRKQLQLYIPMYLAASTFGWTLLAVKAVGVLTLKALLVSKIAFVVTVMMIVKKLMDTSAKMMYPHFPEHQPFMLPYEYGLHSHGLEGTLGANEFYPVHIPSHQAGGAVSELENVAAETAIHHRTVELHNGTLPHHPIVAALAPKITKREDGDTQWTQAGAAVWCNSPEYVTTEWSIMCLAIWGMRIYVWLKYYLDKFNLD